MNDRVCCAMHVLLYAAFIVFMCACNKAPDPTPLQTPRLESKDLVTRKKTSRGDAFGLPLPPRVQRIEEREGIIFVETDLNTHNLHKFFKANLPSDYELLFVRDALHIVGLKEFMPEARASYIAGPRSRIRILYRASRQRPRPAVDSVAAANNKDVLAKKPHSIVHKRPKRTYVRPKKGAPVDLRTPSGKLLAPGARWYEPYIPPKGSPMDRQEYRSNFGKPFGTWQPG